MSTEETRSTRSSGNHAIIKAIRKTRSKQDKGIKRMLEELKDEMSGMKKELKKLNENQIVLCRRLEQLNGSSGDVSPAPRSKPNQMELPRFQLRITNKVKDRVGKGESISTEHGDPINIVMYDGGNLIANDHPLASASVMMVVLNGEFNKDDIKYNWSKEDFQKSIRRPREGNSATGDVNKIIESTVSGGTFNLAGGSCSHSDAKISENSSNKKVRLGVMVVSQTEERVLEGLSNHFLVRDPPKKSKPAPIDDSSTPGNNTEQATRSSTPGNSTHGAHPQQPSSHTGTGMDIESGFRDFAAASEHMSMSRPVQPLWDWPAGGVQPLWDWPAGGVHSSTISDRMSGPLYSPTGLGDFAAADWEHLWDCPAGGVHSYSTTGFRRLPSSRARRLSLGSGGLEDIFLDQLMPLYSRQPKIHSGDFATMRLMPEHYDSLTTYLKMMNLQITTKPKEVMQTHDDVTLLKRKLHNKDPLRFVNKQPSLHTGTGMDIEPGFRRLPSSRARRLSLGLGGLEEYIIRPVQLLWDRPDVEPSKRWNLLDQLMPLYSRQPKIHSGDFPTMRLMPEHYDSLTTYPQGPYQRLFLMKMMRNLQITTIPKEVMQTHRNRGVLIQPLEPDDSDDEPILKRKLHNKYQLRFVNKVCEAYYTREQIKADDGNLLNVALYDENNSKITSGPLSSASVEVVVLHGDFNANGQDYWTPEEFSSCVVRPQSGKGRSVLEGDRDLVLVDGEASVGYAFFQKTSSFARTGKFKMGVKMKITIDERIQEGISESFFVASRQGKGLNSNSKPPLSESPIATRELPEEALTTLPYMDLSAYMEHVFRAQDLEESKSTMDRVLKYPPAVIPHPAHPVHELKLLTTGGAQFQCDGCQEPGYGPRYSSEANQEHTAVVKVANQEQTAAVDGLTMSEACEDAAVQLRFLNCSKPLVYTERKITAEGGMAIKIAIFRDNQIITSGRLSSARIEILALHGDFFYVVPNNWTEYEFDGRIVSSRQGPVLGGDCQLKLKNGVVSLDDICFKKVSSKTDSGKLILAARVHRSDKAGLRVKEAVMNPVEVHVSRNELNAKSNRPKLKDLVCRLRGISGNGTRFKMLQENGISTVEDFRKALNMNEEKIRNEYFKLKKDNKLWKAIVKHAEECDLEGNCKLKSYIVEEQSIVHFFNCVYDLVGAKFHGCYITKDNFNSAQQDVVNRLKEHAYDKLDSIQFDHEIKDNYPIPLSTTTNTSIGDLHPFPKFKGLNMYSKPFLARPKGLGPPVHMEHFCKAQDLEESKSTVDRVLKDPPAVHELKLLTTRETAGRKYGCETLKKASQPWPYNGSRDSARMLVPSQA